MGVRWANSESDPFYVRNGVRQGGNLSPMLFNVYIDKILCDLADDTVLLAPTRAGLQMLVDACVGKAVSLDIKFNTKKTVCMMFLPPKPYSVAHLTSAQPPCIYLDGHNLAWVEEFRYLGHILNSKLDDSADMQRAKRCLYYSCAIQL